MSWLCQVLLYNIIYTFDNDTNIDRLARQLNTIGEFGLTSRDQMYAKAEELKAYNSDKAKADLQRIKELIKVYEEVVEGNYIDNLIKAQAERKQAETKQQHTQKHKR